MSNTRRSARDALARYGDRLSRAETAAHYEAEAAASLAAADAQAHLLVDSYNAGFDDARDILRRLWDGPPKKLNDGVYQLAYHGKDTTMQHATPNHTSN